MVFRTCQRWSKILILAKMTLKDVDVKVIHAAAAAADAARRKSFRFLNSVFYDHFSSCRRQSFNNTAVAVVVVVVRLSTGFER